MDFMATETISREYRTNVFRNACAEYAILLEEDDMLSYSIRAGVLYTVVCEEET